VMRPVTLLRQTRPVSRTAAVLIYALISASLLWARPAAAYSVLAHEGMVDAMWDGAVDFPACPPRNWRRRARSPTGDR
jgi:hypothetical protein